MSSLLLNGIPEPEPTERVLQIPESEFRKVTEEIAVNVAKTLEDFWVENGLTPQIMKVKTFHQLFKCFIQENPNADIPDEEIALRQRLLQEEVDELKEAAEKKDIVEIADALGDILYIAFGTAVAYGLQDKLQEVFTEIHNSNLSKLDENGQPIFREDGKVMKGPNFFRPDIRKILENGLSDIPPRAE